MSGSICILMSFFFFLFSLTENCRSFEGLASFCTKGQETGEWASISQSPERVHFFLFVLSWALWHPCDSKIKSETACVIACGWGALWCPSFLTTSFSSRSDINCQNFLTLTNRSPHFKFVWNHYICGTERGALSIKRWSKIWAGRNIDPQEVMRGLLPLSISKT